MSRRTGHPFTFPPVAITEIEYENGVYTTLLTSGEKFFWEGKMKKSTPPWVQQELLGWISIQRERKRLGLEYLTFTEADAIKEPKRY